MIKHFVENNPDLCGFKFTLNSFENYKTIIETIVERELSRRNNDCLHRLIGLHLCISSNEASLELLNYFDSEELPYSGTGIMQEEYILYIGRLVCPVCDRFDTIAIYKSDII